MNAPDPADLAAALQAVAVSLASLDRRLDDMARRLAQMADDVATVRGIADARRQIDGYPATPIPKGYVARGGGAR